ncbi:hypothetical protein LTR48_000108 [Friedmanniomyces endolithicus]|nr:hypothetical protein LTR48_000108 [Friedmanniomyces endolithicus]
MAAYDIQQHFKGLRADTGRKKGRRDPFATGFEDDSEGEARSRQRDRSKQKTAAAKAAVAAGNPLALKTSVLDALRDSDDEWLGAPARIDRRPSPAPPRLANLRTVENLGRRGSIDKSGQHNRSPRSAIVQATGPLAYLDDSDEEALASPRRADRRPSPAPRQNSDTSEPGERSSTPRGSRVPLEEQPQALLQPSIHTVASPFAGTKYLQDSDSDEEAISSRNNSADASAAPLDDSIDPLSPWESALSPKHPEVKRVDKPKQNNGSGISWRAFSASRIEQRSAEIEALQASLKQRGKSIAFGTHAVTDDGNRVPIAAAVELQRAGSAAARGRRRGRGKSPPRRPDDKLTEEEHEAEGDPGGPVYDPREYKTNPFTGLPVRRAVSDPDRDDSMAKGFTSLTANLPAIRIDDLTVLPQSIPEGKRAEHSLDTVTSPLAESAVSLSRNSSTRSIRATGARRIPNAERERRSSRRSASATTSMSPAQAFLSSWNREGITAEPAQEKPDDEGKSFGMETQYVIGKTVNQGGFGVIKEAHTITDDGQRLVFAVKVVRKAVIDAETMRYAYQLASALRYLHQDMRVCHRDIKLENCLIDMTRPNASTNGGNLRLCDFGLADFLHNDSTADEASPERTTSPAAPSSGSHHHRPTSVIGTLEYASPRGLVANRKLFETAGDIWAYGVIVYALCTGELPFRHAMPSKTVELILQAEWDDGALKLAAAGSDAVIELVEGCLEKDIGGRMTVGEVVGCVWFEGMAGGR